MFNAIQLVIALAHFTSLELFFGIGHPDGLPEYIYRKIACIFRGKSLVSTIDQPGFYNPSRLP